MCMKHEKCINIKVAFSSIYSKSASNDKKAWIINKIKLIFSDDSNLRQFFSSKYAQESNYKQFKS